MKNGYLLTVLFAIFCIIDGISFADERSGDLPLQFQSWGDKADKVFEVPKNRKEINPPYPQKDVYSEKEYLIGKVNYLLPIYSNMHIEDRGAVELSTSMSIGEYEPLTFAVHARKDLTQCDILISDLKNETGNIFPSTAIDVRCVRGRPRLCGANNYFLYPFFLESGDGIDIAGGTTQEYWLTIKSSEEAKSGIYKGTLIFKPSNSTETEMKITLNLFPIHLIEAPRFFYMYYNVDPYWKGFYAKNLRKHLIDMKEHGINSICVYIVPAIESLNGIFKVNMNKKTDFSLFSMQEFVDEYIKTGFKGPIINEGIDMAISYYIKSRFSAKPFTVKADNLTRILVESIYTKQKQENWPLMIMSPSDEPSFSKVKMEICRYYLRLIKNINDKIITYVTLNGAVRGVDDVTYFDPYLDIKVCAAINEDVIEKIEKNNSHPWLYNGGSFGKYPAVDRIFFGFYAEKIRAEGVGQWAYQWPHPAAKNESLYSELKYEQYGWYYTCPSSRGPLPTIGWEGVREGIDDARYIATLREEIKKARQLNNKDSLVLADESEKYIEDILSKIPLNFHRQQSEDIAEQEIIKCLDGNLEILDVWRTGIANRIIEFQKATNNLN